jgi:DNA-binding response OmpR family regulator
MRTVLIAERSPDLLRLLLEAFPSLFPEWRVLGAASEFEAEEIQRNQILTLIVLDAAVSATPQDSIALIRRWRADGLAIPIVATTSARSLAPALWAAGADDVLLKPWDSFDLQHRLERLVRLSAAGREDNRRPRADGVAVGAAFTFGPATITPDFLCHFPDGCAERIGVKEYGILSVFASARGRMILREDLLRKIWGADASTDSNSVNVYLSRLRRLFTEHQADFNRLVFTEAKIGWRISPS